MNAASQNAVRHCAGAAVCGVMMLLGTACGSTQEQFPQTPPPPSLEETMQDGLVLERTTQEVEIPVSEWRTGNFRSPIFLNLPADMQISLFAVGFEKPRMMAFDEAGTLYVTDPEAGSVFALPDTDRNGIADEHVLVADDLGYPTGIVWYRDTLYIADTETVYALSNTDSDLELESRQIIIDDLPAGGGHITRTLAIDDQNMLYVSVGSSCNACNDDPRRATILRYNLDGTGETNFAPGLRNAVGMTWNTSGELYVTENGRDLLGDHLPPDEINAVNAGTHYGWPQCYGNRVNDPKLGDATFCSTTTPATVELPAHVAPLGLRFIPNSWNSEYSNDLLVALHGSWNSSVPVGYKVVRVSWDEDDTPETTDFITGWLEGTTVRGRPVDVIFNAAGDLFITDDKFGAIYRVSRRD